MADTDIDGQPLPLIDGSAWDPFAKVLLLTCEDRQERWRLGGDRRFPVEGCQHLEVQWELPPMKVSRSTPTATSGWSRIRAARAADLTKNAKQPNSFVYRFVPKHRDDLSQGGKLQVLQVLDAYGKPIVFHKDDVNGDILSDAQRVIYGYGNELPTRWLTIHDSDKDGAEPYDANALAKAANGHAVQAARERPVPAGHEASRSSTSRRPATPTPRPRPARSTAGSAACSRSSSRRPTRTRGALSIVLRGDAPTPASITWPSSTTSSSSSSRTAATSCTAQRNAYDSGYVIDVTADYSSKDAGATSSRQTRDDMATIDAGLSGQPTATRTTATTRSPASTCRTAIRRSRA